MLPMVTGGPLFSASRAPYASYGYRWTSFFHLAGTIRFLWLPVDLFFLPRGHHTPPMVTVGPVFSDPQVPYATYGYRCSSFFCLAGTIRFLWLPLSLFFLTRGHHSPPMVTGGPLFSASRAPYASYGYRWTRFFRPTGTIRLLWLPLMPLFHPRGHHAHPPSLKTHKWPAR